MAQAVREVMSSNPQTCADSSSVRQAAELMRNNNIGDVIVIKEDGSVCGVVTDRDITVRAVADGRDPDRTPLADICSRDVLSIEPDADVEDAVRMMRDNAIRRLPVCDGGRAVGVVSIGDLALDLDPRSALADISAAAPNS
jgi:CBS domain-containing protein